jgi:hypothetical protein
MRPERYTGHQTAAIDRRLRESLGFQVKRKGAKGAKERSVRQQGAVI